MSNPTKQNPNTDENKSLDDGDDNDMRCRVTPQMDAPLDEDADDDNPNPI